MPILQAASTLAPTEVWTGVTVRMVHGQLLTLAIAELAPGTVVPEHRHVNEQLGTVVCGSAVFTSGSEVLELGPGGTYRFLADVPHQVTAGPEGAVFVECFAPVRSDWVGLSPDPDLSVAWPPRS